jgi:regulator of RNase E activity RraA
VCVPRAMAAVVAEEALEQERQEEFILARIAAGAPLRGTYPPDAATRAAYQAQQGS